MTGLDVVLQVYPNILVGNKGAAENPEVLSQLGVSHLLNCAGGARRGNCLTGSGKVRPELAGRNIEYRELALRVEIMTKLQPPAEVTLVILFSRTRRARIFWACWTTRLTGWRLF